MNAQLLYLLERGGTAFDAKRNLFAQEHYAHAQLNPYNFPLLNHSLIISLLFSTIVVPREFLDLPENHNLFFEFDAKKVTGYFSVRKPESLNAQLLIRCIRNSVAHALFSITQTSNGVVLFKFWTDRDPIFEATASQDELVEFINIVGVRLVNAMLKHKNKDAAT